MKRAQAISKPAGIYAKWAMLISLYGLSLKMNARMLSHGRIAPRMSAAICPRWCLFDATASAIRITLPASMRMELYAQKTQNHDPYAATSIIRKGTPTSGGITFQIRPWYSFVHTSANVMAGIKDRMASFGLLSQPPLSVNCRENPSQMSGTIAAEIYSILLHSIFVAKSPAANSRTRQTM